MYTRNELVKRKQNKLSQLRRDDLFDEFMMPFSRMFDDFFRGHLPDFSSKYGSDFFEKGSYPKVDILDSTDHISIEAAVPGMLKEDISVEIFDGVLTIAGEKRSESGDTDSYVYRELKRSSFRRSWALGDNLDENKVSAKFEDGMLYLTIPKLSQEDEKKAVKVEIK